MENGFMLMCLGVLMMPIALGAQTPQKPDFTESATGVAFEMKYISPATFQMGSNDNHVQDDEKPVHTVTLSEFYMGKYEVTFTEYDAFCNATGRTKPEDEGWGRGNRPVINVSWDDATAYCNWLSQKTGKTYRLPTEAEWEYAAKGGQNYKYAGSNDLDKVAWYSANSGIKPHPVGEKQPNGWGLYDMSGNVWEWCSDWYSASYSTTAQRDPTGPVSGSNRVFRGGCWYYGARFCCTDFRYDNAPTYRDYHLGFRLVFVP